MIFFLDILGADHSFVKMMIPLGLSFYTFQQIIYLYAANKGETKKHNFIDYILFISFFPQIIAGPIVTHQEIFPQIKTLKDNILCAPNLMAGMFLLSLGLFKKTVHAGDEYDTRIVYFIGLQPAIIL